MFVLQCDLGEDNLQVFLGISREGVSSFAQAFHASLCRRRSLQILRQMRHVNTRHNSQLDRKAHRPFQARNVPHGKSAAGSLQ